MTRPLNSMSLVGLVLIIVPAAHAECPQGQPMKRMIAIERGLFPMRDLWNMGADDFGVSGGKVILRVSEPMLAALDARGVAYERVCDDLDREYEEYRRTRAVAASRAKDVDIADSGEPAERAESFVDYHDLAGVEAAMQRIADEHPDIVALVEIGRSLEGRPIRAFRISDNAGRVEPDEPAMLTLGCHHAREWISVEVPLFYADYLADHYRKDGTVTRLIQYTEQWIVPVLNPDGYAFSRIGYPNSFDHRWWRKNRRNNGDGTFGVDPNRNYLIGFGDEEGSSGLTFSEVYRGPGPFSEPETQAIRDLMSGVTFGRTFATGLSYHNFSQLVMYPNGFTFEPVRNVGYYRDLAAEMTRLINESHSDPQFDYVFGTPVELLYVASGTFEDWAHHTIGATSLIIELRPSSFPFFELPPEEIAPTCRENLPAYLYLAERTLIPGLKKNDPDLDGLVGADDYCPNSPRNVVIDSLGCAATETDVDSDGVANADDDCRDTPAGQQVDAAGCRATPLFAVRVVSTVPGAEIEVIPPDIDANSRGKTMEGGLVREYLTATEVVLNAVAEFEGNRFVRWSVNGAPQTDGRLNLRLESSANVTAEAVFALPTRVEIKGFTRVPDVDSVGRAFRQNLTLRVHYSDGSSDLVTEGVEWSQPSSSVAALTDEGTLLAYDVPRETGEVRTEILAGAAVGAYRFEAPPLAVSIFDADTRRANCRELTISGPDQVASLSRATFESRVMLEGETAARSVQDVRWFLAGGDSGATLVQPVESSMNSAVETEWVPEPRSLVLRAAYLNDDRSACLGEKAITILAGDPAEDPQSGRAEPTGSPFSACGAAGLLSWTMLWIGLMGYRGLRPYRKAS